MATRFWKLDSKKGVVFANCKTLAKNTNFDFFKKLEITWPFYSSKPELSRGEIH